MDLGDLMWSATEEIKLDGYRAIAVKSDNKVRLFSRRQKSFNRQYPYIVEALVDLPDGTVIDGAIVALDDSARPQFNLLQNYRSEARRIRYFVLDLLCYDHRDTKHAFRKLNVELCCGTLKFQSSRIQFLDYLETSATNMVAAAKDQVLEGVVGKQRDSLYQPGRRTGSWVKYRISVGQEFVVGGYFPGAHGQGALGPLVCARLKSLIVVIVADLGWIEFDDDHSLRVVSRRSDQATS
jgi:ATP-dependent DNA ligase